jgi:hypothetical protein
MIFGMWCTYFGMQDMNYGVMGDSQFSFAVWVIRDSRLATRS